MKSKLIDLWYKFIYPSDELRAVYPFKSEFLLEMLIRNLKHLHQLILISEVIEFFLLFFFNFTDKTQIVLIFFLIINTFAIVVFNYFRISNFRLPYKLMFMTQGIIIINFLFLTSSFNIFEYQELAMFHLYLIMLVYAAVVLHIPSANLAAISFVSGLFNLMGVLFYHQDLSFLKYEVINILVFVPLAFYLGILSNQNRILLWMNFKKQKNINDILEDISQKDQMTQFFHHEQILKLLSLEIENVKQKQSELCVLILDVDDFKSINDSLGHLQGDKVLVEIAHTIQAQVREHDYIGRYGGEEFLILFTHTSFKDAKVIADRILKSVQAIELVGCKLSLSGGLSQLNDHSLDELIDEADKRLYQAKREGKNRIVSK